MTSRWLRSAVPITLIGLVWPGFLPVTAQAVAPAAPVAPAISPVTEAPIARPAEKTSDLERKRVDRVKTPKLKWFPDSDSDGLLTTAKLPLDYDKPNGAKVEVALAKLPATDQKHKIGTLFVNPGGPGASSVELAQYADQVFGPQIRARFDVVGVDPRGIANTTNVKCFADKREANTALRYAKGVPITSAERTRYLDSSKKLAQACSGRGRDLASSMSTAEVARDMEVLRRAVGDSKLNYIGFSYGTYLGEVYANMFPDRFRAIVIDGVLDPVAWRGTSSTAGTPTSLRVGSDVADWKILNDIFARCKAAGSKYCRLADPLATFTQIASRLRLAPLNLGGTKITYSDFVGTILGQLYAGAGGPEQIIDIIASLDAVTGGGGLVATQRLQSVWAKAQRYAFPYDNAAEAYAGVICTDGAAPTSQWAWPKAIDARSKSAPYFAEQWGWGDASCARKYWKASDEDRYLGSFSKQTAKPVLVVGNYYDPATPYANAVATQKLMPNSWLLSSDSWGHTAYGTSNCVTASVDAYLLTGSKPALEVCPAESQPFTQPLAGGGGGVPTTMSKLARMGLRPLSLR